MEAKPHIKEAERLNASVIISLSILDHLETEDSASLTELAEALDIHKSRVMRICGTMEQMGYIRRRQTDARYTLGPRVLSLGKAFERQNPLLQVVREQIQKISVALDENLLFQTLRDGKRLAVVAVSRAKRSRYMTPEGSEAKITYGASGKVFLSWGPPELRAEILAEAPYPRYTEHTRTTADELLHDISETISRGYATSYEERTYGTAALAVPVFGEGGRLLGSLSIASTTERLTPELIDRALPMLRDAAATVQSMVSGSEKFVIVRPRRDR